jgi:FtsP/CotA-like multicopper oxidase with cupredoxin domain
MIQREEVQVNGTLPPLGPNFVAMGRFGNVMLVGGETEFLGEANPGEVVRLYLVNAANTRIFDFMAESRK